MEYDLRIRHQSTSSSQAVNKLTFILYIFQISEDGNVMEPFGTSFGFFLRVILVLVLEVLSTLKQISTRYSV